jgi:predicted permease
MMFFYRLLLLAYPASFRAEYGEELSAVFARERSDASGWMLVELWVRTIFDVLFNALSVHLDILRQDVRYTMRTLGRTPGFTLTAITVAALGIGATTAAFTMVDHVLIRPLPFPEESRLVNLYEDKPARGAHDWDIAPANYRDWKQMSSSFDNMGAFFYAPANLVGEGEPQTLAATELTVEMFPTLGVHPLLGRVFTAEDNRDAASAVVLSYGLWQGTFGGRADVLGRKVILDDGSFTVIGVMPDSFSFPTRQVQLWKLLRLRPDAFADRNDNYLYGVARLKPGVSLEKARADLGAIAANLARAYPKELKQSGATVRYMHDEVTGQSLMMLKVLLGAALCVLLIACTNLANLLLARAMVRRKELAVRAAMGAGRERLVRQMLTESLLLALLGGALGVLVAKAALPLLARLVPVTLPIAATPSMDLRVLLFAACVTCGTGVMFGVIPALRMLRGDGLREGSRAGVGGRKERLRSILVIAEVSGSVVLLVCCGLLIRALWRIQATDPGFRSEHVLTLRTMLPMPKYEERPVREAFYRRVLTATRQLPGVTGAAYTSFLPMVMGGGIWPVEIQGQPEDMGSRRTASLRFVTPGYLSVMSIPLLMGRDVSESDTFEAAAVAVVSESFVKRYWPGENPLGRHLNFGNRDRVVVGVAREVKVRGLERTNEPQVYLSYKQHDQVGLFYAPKDLAVRSSGDPLALASSIRRIIHETDAAQPVANMRTLGDIVESQTASRLVQVRVLSAFAAIAFLLAATGIHGLLAFAVSSRTQEIGVRMALGARSADILGMILQEGVVLAAAGIIVGSGLAYGAGQLLKSLLAGVTPGDAATFAAAIVLSAMMALAGSLLPALRAVRVDPTTAIRVD